MYLDLCKERLEYHRKQCSAARKCDNLFQISNVVLTSFQMLSLTIMSNINTSSTDVAIVSGIFTLLITIISRIESSFDFGILNVKHSILVDDFNEIVMQLEYNTENPIDASKLARIISILEKNHLQSVWFPC